MIMEVSEFASFKTRQPGNTNKSKTISLGRSKYSASPETFLPLLFRHSQRPITHERCWQCAILLGFTTFNLNYQFSPWPGNAADLSGQSGSSAVPLDQRLPQALRHQLEVAAPDQGGVCPQPAALAGQVRHLR